MVSRQEHIAGFAPSYFPLLGNGNGAKIPLVEGGLAKGLGQGRPQAQAITNPNHQASRQALINNILADTGTTNRRQSISVGASWHGRITDSPQPF
jgi:hypothetical protein